MVFFSFIFGEVEKAVQYVKFYSIKLREKLEDSPFSAFKF